MSFRVLSAFSLRSERSPKSGFRSGAAGVTNRTGYFVFSYEHRHPADYSSMKPQ